MMSVTCERVNVLFSMAKDEWMDCILFAFLRCGFLSNVFSAVSFPSRRLISDILSMMVSVMVYGGDCMGMYDLLFVFVRYNGFVCCFFFYDVVCIS